MVLTTALAAFVTAAASAKPASKVTVGIIIAALVIFLSIVMFTGNIEATTSDEGFTLNATFYGEITVNYSDIASVELVDESVSGVKVGGFNSARLLLGGFKNDELGSYTSFVYTGKSPSIILRTKNEKIIVIALENADDTTALYNEIASSISEN